MILLLINTAREPAFVALVKDGEILGERELTVDKTLGTTLLGSIDELTGGAKIKKSDIDRVAVHPGPGRYLMALRTGIVTGTTLAQAIGAELVPVEADTLVDILKQALSAEPVAALEPKYEA